MCVRVVCPRPVSLNRYIWQVVSVWSPPWRELRSSPFGIWTGFLVSRHRSSFPPRTADTHPYVETGVHTRPHETAGRQDADQGQDADWYCAPTSPLACNTQRSTSARRGGLDAGRPLHAMRACADAVRILWPARAGPPQEAGQAKGEQKSAARVATAEK